MKEFEGKDIKEVWDYRLSTAVPTIYNQAGSTWRVELNDKGENNEVLESFDTGIAATPKDNWNKEALNACYEWLLSVRDKYARTDIEEIKPIVKKINESNAALSAKGAA